MRGAYETPDEPCPYCGTMTQAEFCDVGVGMVQVSPYHCHECQATEAGPYDRLDAQPDPETGWYPPTKAKVRDASATAGARMRLAALDQDGLHVEPWQNEKDTDND